MPELTQRSLHHRTLPLEYLELVSKLDRFIEESEALKPRKEEAEHGELAELRQLHDDLMTSARAFFGRRGAPSDERDARRAFALGLWRSTYYRETVTGALPLVDTCGSKTLADFELDVRQGDEGRAALREFLAERLDFSQTELAQLEADVDEELRALKLRQDIMSALESRHSLACAEHRDEAILEMFSELYPSHPFRVGEVQVIRTATSVFFCIPFNGLELTRPVGERTEAEREGVATFLRRWSKFKQRYYAHFPVFGFFRGDQAAPELLGYLTEVTGHDADELSDALTTMVSILQSSEVDKYVVHDAWGHQWQALLFRFEETYRAVATYPSLPDLDWRPGGTDSMRDILRAGVERGPEAAVERWDGYFRATMDHRLLLSLAGLVAEVLADAVEYKFILLEPQKADALLSSSFFKDLPTKLDLTLWDLPWYFKIAMRAFIKLVDDPDTRSSLRDGFAATEPAATDLDEVVEAITVRTGELLDFEYRRSLHYEVVDDELVVNAFCRVALNFLAMQSTFNELYAQLRDRPTPSQSWVDRFHDPLIFATASFFELDWQEHFWLVDEFLGVHLPALWRALE